mgnify:CR=1 FL=1
MLGVERAEQLQPKKSGSKGRSSCINREREPYIEAMSTKDDKRTTEEIERQLLLLQLRKENRPWWRKQEAFAIGISVISAAIAIWSFYDSHSSIDQQASSARLEMQQLRIDLNMTAHDSVILTRNEQLRKAGIALSLKEGDQALLAEEYVALKQSAARERIRIYAQVDSLVRMKNCMPESAQLKLKNEHINALESLLEKANQGEAGLSALSVQARREFTDVIAAQMREYFAQQELAATKERLLRAEMERCP